MNALWRKNLETANHIKKRKELGAKMALVFNEKISGFSVELQEILIDDMVTAFKNRLNVLKRANANMQTAANKEDAIEFEILKPQVKNH